MAEVKFVDTTLRDGNQSLWGAIGMSNEVVLPIAPTIARARYRTVDFTNSMMMSIAARIHREDPWERLRLVKAAIPNAPLGLITGPNRFITWNVTPPALMKLGLSLLVRNGIGCFYILDPMNNMDETEAAAAIVKQAGEARTVIALTYSISPLHTDEHFVKCAERVKNSKVIDALYFKDPGGLATPERIAALFPKLHKALEGGRVKLEEIHTHCNTGLAPLNHLEAIKQGVRIIHTAVGPLANGTSHPSAASMIRNVRALGHDVDLDEAAIEEASRYFRRIALRDGLPLGKPVEYDASYYTHQIPGGMYSTMRRQLTEVGLQDRFEETLREVPLVRKELGYPIMVTPFSQFVGAQALMNVISGKRYSMVPDEIIHYLLGSFGKVTGPVDPDVQSRILESRRAREIAALPPVADGEETIRSLRKKLGSNVSDEELMLRATMKEEDVDGMRRGHAIENGISVAQPLADAIRAFAQRKHLSSISIGWKKTHISVSRAQVARPG